MPYHLQQAVLEDTQKTIRELELDENRKKELATALHAQFKDWLYGKISSLRLAIA
jgi:TBCC domain-containing protein 1